MNSNANLNELEEFNLIKKEALRLSKSFEDVKKINPKDAEFIENLEKYHKKIPKGEDVKRSVEEIGRRMEQFIEKSKQQRSISFPRTFNKYLQSLNETPKRYQIIDTTIVRVGCLQIETKPEIAKIRFLFNKIVLIPWKPVVTVEDVNKYEIEALDKLKSAEIPEDILADIFLRAYKNIRYTREKTNKANPSLVPINDLYSETLVELFRQQIIGRKKFNTKLKEIYLPDWAFVYNLDRYRHMYHSLPDEKRLSFEIGSQSETEKIGVVLNGLDPKSVYKKICYVSGRGDI
ncbi:hypothetical protein SAMN04488587_2009 [Methanococcoides vulcani]|uniref:Uncharacterized protein n=2 Tax=Methanococcoides vulcani TaxID=1353158 RepID=A0A1I0B6Q2_9EURY|nr:hypothetical protein SAMN04488587_2009 [Methanococcoides vulcani]